MFGRVRMYNAGFTVFTAASVLLSFDPFTGSHGAMWLIGWRLLQAAGGSMLMANSAAILTDAFPSDQRGFALGTNQIAGLAGQFVGLSAVLIAVTYGIQPYRHHTMGWESPAVLGMLADGLVLLAAFTVIENRVAEPMFQLGLLRIRAFTAGSFAGLLGAVARGGLQFMLIIWLQGIWLPLHGYDYASMPLWAGIFLLPLTPGFLVAGPVSGTLSDRLGSRGIATAGMVVFGGSFIGLLLLPADFPTGRSPR